MDCCDARHEAFMRLMMRHSVTLRATIRGVLHRTEDVDEVMQTVCLVAWKKFDTLTEPEGFARWACVIARHEILKFLRCRARDRFMLDESLAERILEEGELSVSIQERRLSQLERCLEKLPVGKKALLLEYYSPGCTAKAVARHLGKSEDALYQLLRRLRLVLKNCMELNALDEDGVA
jgi:RNA polymerase sigma-70 factor (ECF subfamily)